MSRNNLLNYIKNSSSVIINLDSDLEKIVRMAEGIYESQIHNGKLLIGGNGGSCADAEHFSGELTCTYKNKKRKAFSAISLTNNSSAITAWANDFKFDSYFERQVLALGKKNDVLFLLSTGGGDIVNNFSMNLVYAAKKAKDMGLKVYSLIGKTGGELLKLSDESILVKSDITSHIQEAHIVIIHMLCEMLDSYEV
jgi:D-sedoheptulose 7-phosphate isomerase